MRELEVVTIDVDGRDKGKTFVIKEMSAWALEKFGYRLTLALTRAGVDIGEFAGSGFAGLVMAGVMSMPLLDFRDAEPLLDEMMEYVFVRPDPARPDMMRPLMRTPDGDGDDVQEVTTFYAIRAAFMKMHARFFSKGMPSKVSTSGATTSQELPAA